MAKAAAQTKKQTVASRPNRVFWFRLLALSLPVLLFAVAEVGLRIAGFGYSTKFFLAAGNAENARLIENHRYGRRFFPPAIARSPLPLMLAQPKPPGAKRIFVLGESAAMGDPEPAYGLSRQLEILLQTLHPDHPIEVINVAMTAINSHVVRRIASDCAEFQADAWIIYAGNNEVIGPYGAATVFGRRGASPTFVALDQATKVLKLRQWLDSLGANNATADWQGMEFFLQQQVRQQDPRLESVYRNYDRNLRAIVRRGQSAGARVLLATMAVNLSDCPPFGSLHGPGLTSAQAQQWTNRFSEGIRAEAEGRYRDALAAYEQANSIDHGYAELAFRKARCELHLRQTDRASADYALARDLDTLRFRADTRINAITREVAKASDATLVDVEWVFGVPSANVPGETLFYDHVHLNFEGNYRVATNLLPSVEKALFGSASTNVPSVDALREALAFAGFDERRIAEEMRARLKQPPFSTQLGAAERDARLATNAPLSGNAPADLGRYTRASRLRPNDWVIHANFARFLESTGDANAASEWRQVTRLMPYEPDAWFQLGNLAYAAGRLEEANGCFAQALARRPDSTETLNGLALTLAAQGQRDSAAKLYRRALKLNPRYSAARVNLALLLADSGDFDGAASAYREVLRSDKSNVAARINYGKLLTSHGKLQEGIALYNEALALDANNAIAHYDLANALSQKSDHEGAITHYRAAVSVDPRFADAHYSLALELSRANRVAEALPHLAQVTGLRPDFIEARYNYGIALAKQQRFAEAIEQFQEVLRLDPKHSAARAALDLALRRVGQR